MKKTFNNMNFILNQDLNKRLISRSLLIIEKIGVDNDEKNFVIKVYFEKNPLVLRAVEVLIGNEFLKLSIYNHTYEEEFDKNFFKLINPKFLN